MTSPYDSTVEISFESNTVSAAGGFQMQSRNYQAEIALFSPCVMAWVIETGNDCAWVFRSPQSELVLSQARYQCCWTATIQNQTWIASNRIKIAIDLHWYKKNPLQAQVFLFLPTLGTYLY